MRGVHGRQTHYHKDKTFRDGNRITLVNKILVILKFNRDCAKKVQIEKNHTIYEQRIIQKWKDVTIELK